MNRLKELIFLIIFGISCTCVVIHAGLKSNEMVTSKDKKTQVLWDVVFEPNSDTNEIIVNHDDGVEYTIPQLFDGIVNDFDIKFTKPEQEISYKFNLINNSEYDAYILHYNKPKIACVDDDKQCLNNLDKIEYTFIYEDETEVTLNDVIKSKEEKTVIIKIKYKKNKEEVPMNLTKLGFSLTFAKVK